MSRKNLKNLVFSGLLAVSMAPALVTPVLADNAKSANVAERSVDYAIAKVQFVVKEAGQETVLAGGDYRVAKDANGNAKYQELNQFCPVGYKVTMTGDYTPNPDQALVVYVTKFPVVSVKFVDDETNAEILTGDAQVLVDENNITQYSQFQGYVPEGYELTLAGDVKLPDDGTLEIRVHKKAEAPKPADKLDVALQFVTENDEIVGHTKATLPVRFGNTANYKDVAKYVPEGYELALSGDFVIDTAHLNKHIDITVRKVEAPKPADKLDVALQFVTENDEIVGHTKAKLPVRFGNTANYKDVEKYVPEGYELALSGDFLIDTKHLDKPIDITVRKVNSEKPETPEEKPENPQKPSKPENNKPSKPGEKPAAKPEKHEGVNTGDFASLFAGISAVTAGSGAAVLAMRKKKNNK